MAAAAYLVSSLAPVNSTVHAICWLSPSYWAVGNGQLTTGVSATESAALVGLAVALHPSVE